MTSGTGSSPASIVVQRRIEWSDTDASGRWHNTAGFRLVEVAETALLESIGILHEVYGRLPRARIAADFTRGLSFKDVVDCCITVRSVGTSSVTYDFELRTEDGVCMTAEVVAVLLGEAGAPTEWSEEHRRLLLGAGPQPPERLTVG